MEYKLFEFKLGRRIHFNFSEIQTLAICLQHKFYKGNFLSLHNIDNLLKLNYIKKAKYLDIYYYYIKNTTYVFLTNEMVIEIKNNFTCDIFRKILRSYNKIKITKQFDIKYVSPKMIKIIYGNFEKKYELEIIKGRCWIARDYENGINYLKKIGDIIYIIDDYGNKILMYSNENFKYENIFKYIVK